MQNQIFHNPTPSQHTNILKYLHIHSWVIAPNIYLLSSLTPESSHQTSSSSHSLLSNLTKHLYLIFTITPESSWTSISCLHTHSRVIAPNISLIFNHSRVITPNISSIFTHSRVITPNIYLLSSLTPESSHRTSISYLHSLPSHHTKTCQK